MSLGPSALENLQIVAANRISADAMFNGSVSDNGKPIPVAYEIKGDVQNELERAIESIGICVVILTPTFRLNAPELVPETSLDGFAQMLISVFESRQMNPCGIHALAAAQHILGMMHGFPTGLTAANGDPAIFRSDPKGDSIILANDAPALQYTVPLIARVLITPPGGGAPPTTPPAPQIISLAPATGVAGTQLSVQVNGNNFTTSSVVRVAGASVPTTFVSTSILSATFTPVAGANTVSVFDGGQTSNAVTFTGTVPTPPAPQITSLSPSTGAAGTQLTVQVNGSNFTTNSVVHVAGAAVTTAFVNATTLNATFTPVAGSNAVTVVDTGQTSNAVTFTGTSAAFTIGQTTPGGSTTGTVLMLGTRVTLSKSASIQSISVYLRDAGGVNNLLGIYSDISGTPGNLLGSTAVFSPVAGWNTQPVIGTPTLSAGTYWLCLQSQQAFNFYYNSSGSNDMALTNAQPTWSGSLPTPFPPCSLNPFDLSLYATLI